MGQGFGILCRNCGARDEFLIGVGFMYSSLDRILPIVNRKTRQKLTDILSRQTIHDEEYEQVLLSCPDCNTLHNRFYVKVVYGNNEVFETKFRCGKCRKALVSANKSIERYRCKECGYEALEQECQIMWD